MSLMAVGTASGLFFLCLGLGRKLVLVHWVHLIVFMIAGVVLLNSLSHLYLTAQPEQTTNLLLLIIGVGFLFLSIGWMALVLIITLAGWAGVAWLQATSPAWVQFGFALFTAALLAVLVHTVRFRTMRRLEGFRLRDERQKAELKAALISTEAAHHAAEASKRELMQSEARLRLLTNQMPAVLWTTDSELRFTSALGMGLTSLHLQPNEIAGLTLFEYYQTSSPDFLPISAHRHALEGASVAFEMRWQDRSFDCQVEPLRDANGDTIGVIGIALDISERKLAEEQVKTSLKEKEALIKEIHHRVKNNLQVISSLLNLQAGYITDESARFVFKESQNRLKAMSLIHEKLYQSEDLTSIDFSGYIRNLAVHLFRSYKVDANAVNLQIDVDPIVLDIDRAIPCGLIINELVSNALKYAFPNCKASAGEAGEIRIDLHGDNDRNLTLVVRDNGIGFPSDLDFRNTSTLGLQLINTLTDQIEGNITLERNGGTAFKIVFRQ
jgi:PAS domain S-box-containing protein